MTGLTWKFDPSIYPGFVIGTDLPDIFASLTRWPLCSGRMRFRKHDAARGQCLHVRAEPEGSVL